MLLRGLIGVVLRRIRIAQNRTLRDVAESARVSVPYLSEVERGRKEPSSELLAAICDALDLELTDLLAEVRFEIARAELTRLPVRGRTITSTTSVGPAPTAVHNSVSGYDTFVAAPIGAPFGAVTVAA